MADGQTLSAANTEAVLAARKDVELCRYAVALQGDMPNYTDIVPIIQFNDVALTK